MKDVTIISSKIPGGVFPPISLSTEKKASLAIDRKHRQHPGELGNPIEPYQEIFGDYYRHYELGVIFYSSAKNKAFEVHGAIYQKYQELGGLRGNLGYPESDEVDSNNGWKRHSLFYYNLIAWKDDDIKVFARNAIATAKWNPENYQINLGVGVKGRGFSGGSKLSLWTEGFSPKVDAGPRTVFNSMPDGTFDVIFKNFPEVTNRPYFKVRVEDPDSGLVGANAPRTNSITAAWIVNP